MKVKMTRFQKWRFDIKKNSFSICLALGFFLIAAFFTYLAGNYADNFQGAGISDLILDNIPALQLSLLFVVSIFFLMAVLIIYPLFFKVDYLAFVIAQMALLVLIRSFSMILTHMPVPEGAIFVDFPSMINLWNFDNDLFFSGHVAIPFLGYLLFKKSKIRYFFLLGTALMVALVLLTHRHYSIDVFAAFFITYGSYRFFNWIFIKNKMKLPRIT